MKLTKLTKPVACPKCGSTRIADILYGLPGMDSEMEKKIREGKIAIGGCCMSDDNPVWQCADCGAEFPPRPE